MCIRDRSTPIESSTPSLATCSLPSAINPVYEAIQPTFPPTYSTYEHCDVEPVPSKAHAQMTQSSHEVGYRVPSLSLTSGPVPPLFFSGSTEPRLGEPAAFWSRPTRGMVHEANEWWKLESTKSSKVSQGDRWPCRSAGGDSGMCWAEPNHYSMPGGRYGYALPCFPTSREPGGAYHCNNGGGTEYTEVNIN
eukprot:TRINITY_DN4917_c0_g2_i2.p1 TRINITY_DN4917_c0_g2~~TRINITY_DN4917_c0_g2_i2.p1  ORF type:complete len:192 (-),score=16.52 TRINITY_DN4917_c0_g2_i2:226-801(-)